MARIKQFLVCQTCGKDITKIKHKKLTCSPECFKIYRKKRRSEWYQLNKTRIAKHQSEYKKQKRVKIKQELRGFEK